MNFIKIGKENSADINLTLIIHGDDDQIVPIGASALLSSKLVKDSTLKIYKGGSHGICSTNKNEVNVDLIEFLKS